MEFWSEPGSVRRGAALDLWREYPVTTRPRVPVLLGSRVSIDGYADGEAKAAFLDGNFEVTVAVPLAVRRALPARRDHVTALPIRVVAAERSSGSFDTDRGAQSFPAWQLTIEGLRGPCLVLDPDITGWWPAGPSGTRLREAGAGGGTLAADQMTLTTHGGMASRDDDTPTINFAETDTAVLIYQSDAKPRAATPPSPKTISHLAILAKRVTTLLPSPLGDRVLLDWRGVPLRLQPARRR